MNDGYILTSRKLLNSEIWSKPPLYIKVWMYLLLKAQHSDYKGLKRGQLITSIPEIQEACSYYVGYRKVTPSKKEVWGVINFLKNDKNGSDSRNPHEGTTKGTMIVTTKVTQGMLVTICNYNDYQDPKNYEGNSEGTTKELRREEQGNNINKNGKNDKNDNNINSPVDGVVYRIVKYMNEHCGTHYRPTTKETNRLIKARLNEDFDEQDFYRVIDNMSAKWLNDPKMKDFLRPQTLFGSKFESYLNCKPTTGNVFADALMFGEMNEGELPF